MANPESESKPEDVHHGFWPHQQLIAMDHAFVLAVVKAIKSGEENCGAITATVRLGQWKSPTPG